MKKRPAIPTLDGGPQTILLVEDVGRTAEFYQEVLRLEAREGDGERYVEFETGDGGVLLIVQRDGSIAPMASVAAAGSPATLTFSVTADGYETWKKWMAKRGVEIAQETKWIHGGRSLYVLDPDGRRIEFKAPAAPRGEKDSAPPAPASAPANTSAAPKVEATKPAPPKPEAVPAPAPKPPAESTHAKSAETAAVHTEKPPADAKSAAPAATPVGTTATKSAVAPPIHGVVESVLYTDDLPRAVAFYRDVVGLKPLVGDEERFQAFDAGGAGRVLLLFKRGATLEPAPAPIGMIPPHDGHGPHHIALGIDTADYDAWRARLRAHKVSIESETGWDRGGRSIYFRDPDNHLVELVTPGIWPNY